MTCAITPKSMARQWRKSVCAIIENSLGLVMAQSAPSLPCPPMAHQWRTNGATKPRAHPVPPAMRHQRFAFGDARRRTATSMPEQRSCTTASNYSLTTPQVQLVGTNHGLGWYTALD